MSLPSLGVSILAERVSYHIERWNAIPLSVSFSARRIAYHPALYSIGMCRGVVQQTLVLLVFAAASGATADTVKLQKKTAFRNVTITDFRGQRLIFRGLSRQVLQKNLDDVEWLALDGRPEFNAAEQAAAAGAWSDAVSDYETSLAAADAPWLRDLIRVRLLRTLRHTGYFDRAVRLYVESLRSGTPPTRQAPAEPGPVGSDTNRRARTMLEDALASAPAPAAAEALRTLLLELLLYEDVEPLPASLTGIAATTRPVPASRPTHSRPIGILPGPDDESEPRPTSHPLSPPTLPADSFVRHGAQSACDAGDYQRAARLLERGLPFVAPANRGPWRLLLGRCRIELGDYADAAADLLNLAETAADPARSAEALYYVARAHERMGRSDVAQRLYEQLLQRSDAPEDVKTRARADLERLKPPQPDTRPQ